jgi:hypothetical protein
MSDNTPAEDSAEIPVRPYWGRAARDQLRGEWRLTLEEDPNISWSFPIAQLLSFNWDVFEVDRHLKTPGDRNKMKAGTLILRFPDATVTVQTQYPEQVLRTILSGQTSVLVRGPRMATGSGIMPHLYYRQENPKAAGFDRHFVFTGPITVDYE